MNKTIKTSTKVLSNTILAAALAMGNVNVQTSQDYYEDKEGFHQVSTSMENGWGWSLGFNKANANTCSNNLITNCEVGEGEDTTEHIPVVGQRPPTDPWQGVPEQGTVDRGSTSGGSGGSGSGNRGGTTFPPMKTPEQEKEICINNANGVYSLCINRAIAKAETEFNDCNKGAGFVDLILSPGDIEGAGELLFECNQVKTDVKLKESNKCEMNKINDLNACV
ncbi:hypothetical protein SG34_007505 [Thalassomonas viridans]|uniref:Secreted protein n=1 Tax=Thalassomonas viridans TaxID=137584 RepID=A0AAE9Z4R6_9GAMM|nr:hypothetical protein [Thalassomonas viridans]WDE06741.1 hypothetical protein SG34_007505 [Thalassomonas viridans]